MQRARAESQTALRPFRNEPRLRRSFLLVFQHGQHAVTGLVGGAQTKKML